jgi:hypothetical protein
MAVVVVGLSFVGYTVAKTIIDYEGSSTEDVPVNITPPEDTEEIIDSPSDEPGLNEPLPEPPPLPEPIGKTVYAPPNVLTNQASLSSYLESAKTAGYEAVVIEMKDSEGRLLYKSDIEVLSEENEPKIIIGTLTAGQVVSACEAAGLRPVARINTLMDRLSPSKIKEVSYKFADGSNMSWMDNSPENGGKFWANPFLSGTKAYLSEITSELYKAWFDTVIFANTVFPDFKPYDISILSSELTDDKTRFSALGNLLNYISENSHAEDGSPGVNILLEISLNDIINGGEPVKTAEILRANSLAAGGIVLIFTKAEAETAVTGGNITTPELSALVKDAFSKAESKTELEIIPLLDGSALSESDMEKILIAFSDMGYESFISRN